MSEPDTQLILQAIKAQGEVVKAQGESVIQAVRAQSEKFGDLVDVVRRLVDKSASPVPATLRNGWQPVVMMLLIVGAITSLMYVWINGLREDVAAIRVAMVADDTREAADRKAFSGLDERFAEVETQFGCARELTECQQQRMWDAINGKVRP